MGQYELLAFKSGAWEKDNTNKARTISGASHLHLAIRNMILPPPPSPSRTPHVCRINSTMISQKPPAPCRQTELEALHTKPMQKATKTPGPSIAFSPNPN